MNVVYDVKKKRKESDNTHLKTYCDAMKKLIERTKENKNREE